MERLKLNEAATQYAVDNVHGSFCGNEEELRTYAMEDFIEGAIWMEHHSKAPEMLEMLEKLTRINPIHGEFHELKLKALNLIKEATEL